MVMISSETIDKVAKAARLSLTDEEREAYAKELNGILKHFSSLDKVNTDNVEPAFHPVKVDEVVREDKSGECLSTEEALSNTEHKEGSFFKGPRAV